MRIKKLPDWFVNNENYFFFFIVILNLYPVLVFRYFPTMDGAAHLYNSNLLVEMLTNSASRVHNFFAFNPQIVPNWTGHIVMGIVTSVFPAYIAEKSILIIYLFGLPLSFRRLLVKGLKTDPALSYLIFPLVYTFLFINGFYNYSIGIVFMFIAINYWVQNRNKFTLKKGLIFFLFVYLVYFSHLFIFMVFGLVIFVLLIYDFLITLREEKNKWPALVKEIVALLIIFALSFILSIDLFTSGKFSGGEASRLPLSRLFDWLFDVRASIGFFYDKEAIINNVYFGAIVLLVLYILYHTISKLLNNGFSISKVFSYSRVWLVISLILLALYFAIPNHLPGRGGHMSVRFLIVFYIFFVLWLATQKYPIYVKRFVIAISIFSCFWLLGLRTKVIKRQNKVANEIVSYEKLIKPHSIILPIRYSKVWLQGHYHNYLGINRPQIMLENYECDVGVFPLKWNKERIPKLKFGNVNQKELCIKWPEGNNTSTQEIEYVFIWGLKDKKKHPKKCTKKIDRVLQSNYILIRETKTAKLFRLKDME